MRVCRLSSYPRYELDTSKRFLDQWVIARLSTPTSFQSGRTTIRWFQFNRFGACVFKPSAVVRSLASFSWEVMRTMGGAHVHVWVPCYQSIALNVPQGMWGRWMDEICSGIRHGKRTSLQARLTLTEAERVTGISESVFFWPFLTLS